MRASHQGKPHAVIVCHCRAVSDRVIRAAIECGADREEHLGDRCDAGRRCGGCLPTLRRLLEEHGRIHSRPLASARA
ncbi:MAG: (2Fe-2S)-binding protein [Actinomycetota bacterium]